MDNENDNEIVRVDDLIEYENRNLGGCDNDSLCTYEKGYVHRQALYSCKTCYEQTNKLAGICYPCSINCHEDHELIDMYTKRNFRCDCGNCKFTSPCLLMATKDPINTENVYNDNFKGIYCVCKQLEEDVELDQWQCNICEDWFHLEHLVSDPKELSQINFENSEEFTCQSCLDKTEWLNTYQQAQFMNILDKDIPLDECRYKKLNSEIKTFTSELPPKFSGGCFWRNKNWRKFLCKCNECIKLACAKFLTDNTDAVSEYMYESQCKTNNAEEAEISNLLGSLPHDQAMRLAEGVATIKNELQKVFEESIKDGDGCLTIADVDKLTERLQAKKRRYE